MSYTHLQKTEIMRVSQCATRGIKKRTMCQFIHIIYFLPIKQQVIITIVAQIGTRI